MKKMFLLFSHKLTSSQEEDAKSSLGIIEFVYLPNDLQELWSNIPPHLDSLDAYLEPLKEFLFKNAKKDDYILVQGDFCGVHEMVNFSKQNSFIPIYSTTKRDVKEKIVGNDVKKLSIFLHVKFRKY